MVQSVNPPSVRSQIEYLLGHSTRSLRFPSMLEAQFERACGASRARRLWREGLISIIAFNIFYLSEWLLTRQISRRELLIQMLLITPLSLVVNVTMRFNPPRWLREGSVSLMTCVISCTYLMLQHGKQPVAVAFTLVAVIVTAMFSAVVMRLRFAYALSSCSVIVVGGLAFLIADHVLTMEEKISGAALMVIAIGIVMMSNYSMEREERIGYLRYLQSEWQREEVSEMNAQLEMISTQDKLTGLPNRRSYEKRYEALWTEARAQQSALALIVIDVDHFKVLNDVRGHIYGDEVLRRVGSLLPQALRSTADFAARYGGEEFVVVLPHTERESAERVAERIRALIEMAGSPSQPALPQTECVMWVTASCGVATCVPGDLDKKEDLLECADKAMYQAKMDGRNRVCYRAFEKSQSESALQDNVA